MTFLLALIAYLLGSIPFGYLIVRLKEGKDVRSSGSGNMGATNVLRTAGRGSAVMTLLLDAAKGYLAVGLAGWSRHDSPQTVALAAIAAVLGHLFPAFLKFKGGKGIATSAGVLTALVPWALLIIFSLFIVLSAITRFISVGSLAASFSLPFATWFTTRNWTLTAATGAMGVLAIYRHKANIQRLLNGTEPRFGQKKSEEAK